MSTVAATGSPPSLGSLSTLLAQPELLDASVCRQKTASRKKFFRPPLCKRTCIKEDGHLKRKLHRMAKYRATLPTLEIILSRIVIRMGLSGRRVASAGAQLSTIQMEPKGVTGSLLVITAMRGLLELALAVRQRITRHA